MHITQATLDYLQGEYEVEAGNGASRNQYLRDHCVTTYFIVPPARRRKVFNMALLIRALFVHQEKKETRVEVSTSGFISGLEIAFGSLSSWSNVKEFHWAGLF